MEYVVWPYLRIRGVDKTFEAGHEIRVEGIHEIPSNVNITLSAPKVTLANPLTAEQGATVTIRPDGCN
jgi:hypothetical protein